MRRGPHGIGAWLVALILLAAVPLFLVAAFLVVRQGELQHQAFERSLLQTSRALSLAVDRQLALYQAMLETLAEDDALRRDDLAAFHELAARVAAREGALFVSFFDASGRQLFNTLRPSGEKLPTPFKDAPPREDGERPPVGDADSIKAVLRTGRPYCSDLFWGLVAGRLIFTVNIPIVRDGAVRYVLNAAFAPDVMTQLLTRDTQFAGAPATVLDRRGFIIGRWRDAARHVGERSAMGPDGTMRDNAGVSRGLTKEGMDVYYSYVRSPATGWGVNVGAAVSRVDARATWLTGGLLAAAALALGVAMALVLAGRLRASIAGLAAAAARNAPPMRQGLRTREIAELERALAGAAAARNAQWRERESRLVAEARKAEAEQASRAKDHFLAVLSHELRNPLAPIRNSVALLRALQARGGPVGAEVVDILDRQSAQLARLVSDLLDVSRITSGKIVLERTRVDLREVARHALETVQPRLAQRGLQLEQSLPAAPVEVLGDFARLSQIASNLLDNAVKFTPAGGRVSLSVGVEGGGAVLRVADTGRGIAPELLPEVFHAYLQGEARATRQGGVGPQEGGLGLGLSLSRTLAELHGGALHAQSEGVGRGSTFVLRLPLAWASAPAAATTLTVD